MPSKAAESNLAKPILATEEADYLEIGGEQLYYVLHRSCKPAAQMLLPGHFVTERPFAYALWVRWARYLAERGISALRFDYRGCGESTGEFHRFTLASWQDDCRACYGFLEAQDPGVPILFGGIGLGGLLASRLFKEGLGAAMLLWSPSASGAGALRDTLLRRLAFDMTTSSTGRSKSWSDYESSLRQGESIEAAGYILSPALWREAVEMKLVLPEGGRDNGVDSRGRAWKVTKLGQAHVPLVPGGGLWQALNPGLRMRLAPLNPDLKGFFEENVQWIHSRLNDLVVKP
jgi:pimeloyl-ACP methyl ester carboxylesterase